MSSPRTMSTQQIKKGLQNIKKAQLQVLKQLKGDSYIMDDKSINNKYHHLKISQNKIQQYNGSISVNQNIENIQINGNVDKRNSLVRKTNEKRQQQRRQQQKKQQQKRQQQRRQLQRKQQQNKQQKRRQWQNNHNKSIRTNDSSLELSSSNQNYQILKRQFASQRQQFNNKFIQITNKLNNLQKQSKQIKYQSQHKQTQLNLQIKNLQQLNRKLQQTNNKIQSQHSKYQSQHIRIQNQYSKLQSTIRSKNQQIQDLQINEKKYKGEIQIKNKQKTILQTQLKFLKMENIKLNRTLKQLETQIKQQNITIRQLKLGNQTVRHQKSRINMDTINNQQQGRVNMDIVMKQVKSISQSHQFIFNKLKQSTSTLQMSWVQKESQIQNSFSRLLQYFQNISSSASSNNYLVLNEQNKRNGSNTNKSKQNIKRSMIQESRLQQRQQLQYFVKQMGDHLSRKQVNQLIQQNYQLKRKLKQLSSQLKAYHINPSKQPRNVSQSHRLISLQLQDMKEEVLKFKKFKQQIKLQQQEQQHQIVKYKIKIKDLQAKLQTNQRKYQEINHLKFSLQKKCQQQSIQITSLNSIIKQINNKLYTSPQSDSSLNHLRQEFNKMLQTNSLLQREKQSFRAMNQSLQVQIQNLKYQKDQFQSNNKQKHQLIQRQIRQRNHLLEEINKKQIKFNQLKDQCQKLKTTLILNQQQTLKVRQNFQNLLQQKNQQLLQLRKQIQQLLKQSRQYHQIRFKFDKLQMQYKQLTRKSVKMGETLSHLWSVKEAQYHNINQVLGMLKNPQHSFNEQQNSAHF